VAQEYSDSPTKDRGGDLGTIHRGELAAEIEKAAFALPVGAVSGLIRTGAGWNILKVEEIHTETVAPFAEVRESIRDALLQEKFEAKRKDWLAELRSRASIHILMEKGILLGAAKDKDDKKE
jgi:parvulin-like peptidyl-prolyl isomerase